MSNSQRYSGDDGGKNAELSSSTAAKDAAEEPVPRQLKEVVELMSSINRRFEDCAVEWQSSISQKQWRIIDSKPASEKPPWEHSLLARTYFTEPSLDETFQCLLVQGKNFTEQINNFIALLSGEEPPAITATVCADAQNQCPDQQSMDCQEQSSYPVVVAPLDLSLLEIQSPLRKTRKSKRLAAGNSSINIVQQSFADLMKAKINLDTKFLGFDAVLNGTSHAVAATANSSPCLCQICSNVLGSALDKGNAIKGIAAVRQKGQRVTRVKNKRLKTTRTWNRRKTMKNQTVSLAQIGNQATPIASARSYKSIAE